MKHIDKIIDSWKTVFTYEDLKIILWIENKESIKSLLARLKKNNILKNIYKWIYVLNNYSELELASKLKKNSYISLETVLQKNWIVFQDYSGLIFSVNDDTIEKKLWDFTYKYNKIKDSILHNPTWIINKKNYQIASSERAICDRIYLSKNYFFDDLESIDKEKLLEISQIYNKRVILEVKKLLKNAK